MKTQKVTQKISERTIVEIEAKKANRGICHVEAAIYEFERVKMMHVGCFMTQCDERGN